MCADFGSITNFRHINSAFLNRNISLKIANKCEIVHLQANPSISKIAQQIFYKEKKFRKNKYGPSDHNCLVCIVMTKI